MKGRWGGRRRQGRGADRARASGTTALLVAAVTVGGVGVTATAPAAAQQDVELDGLIRAGLRVEPDASERNSGFEAFDVRLGARGRAGVLFDYRVLGEWEGEDRRLGLLDAFVTIAAAPEARISVGQLKAPFGEEFLRPLADISFVERSQASDALVPDRQVGASVAGGFLEERLTYAAGIFNGNGRRLRNDDGRFLYAARAQYNSVGPVAFYRELVVQVGANLAFSRDSAVELGVGLGAPEPPDIDPLPPPPTVDFTSFQGDRLLWGVDARVSWRALRFEGEYLRGELDPVELADGELVAEGGYLQGSYGAMGGLLEGVLRWDAFRPAVGERRDYLLFGANLYPGFQAKLGLQYAASLRRDQAPGPRLAGGQLALLLQATF